MHFLIFPFNSFPSLLVVFILLSERISHILHVKLEGASAEGYLFSSSAGKYILKHRPITKDSCLVGSSANLHTPLFFDLHLEEKSPAVPDALLHM